MARGLACPTCPWICHFALRGASCNHTMGILQKFSESAFPLICLGAPQPSSSVPCCAVPRPETNYADEPRKVMQAPASRACTRRRARRMSRFPRAMRRTREERRGYPRALARSPRPFSSSAQLERVTYSRPSVGRLSVVGSRYSLGQTPPSIFLCGRQTFRTGRKMRSSMKALPPFPLRALSSSPPPVFVI